SRLPRLLLGGLLAALLVAPWLLYVYAATGSPMPSSGYAQGGWPKGFRDGGGRVVHALVHSVAPSFPWSWNPVRGTSAWRAPRGPLLLSAPPVLLGLAVLARSRGSWTTLRSLLRTLRPVLLAFALLTAAYVVLIRARWFYPRYLLFWILALLPMVAILIA